MNSSFLYSILPAWADPRPPLDEDSIAWLFDTYAWALTHLDSGVFGHDSQLVLPTREFFPDPANSPQALSEHTFKRVRDYAGLINWPLDLVAPGTQVQTTMPSLTFQQGFRGNQAEIDAGYDFNNRIKISYNPNQLKQPAGLIASYAHNMAAAVVYYAGGEVPGGRQNWGQATEVVACFMGFGLMFANSAYTFRGGCGSCYSAAANRQASLGEDDVTYALALFCVLKQIPTRQVLPHLKKYLRPMYKRCVKDINKRRDSLSRLQALV